MWHSSLCSALWLGRVAGLVRFESGPVSATAATFSQATLSLCVVVLKLLGPRSSQRGHTYKASFSRSQVLGCLQLGPWSMVDVVEGPDPSAVRRARVLSVSCVSGYSVRITFSSYASLYRGI